jgi:VanZ family protein
MVFLRYHLPVILYAVLIFVGSSISGLPPEIPYFDFRDKVLHIFEFAGLGVLLWRSIQWWKLRWSILPILMLSWVLGMVYAASDEIHQLYVPGREASAYDWLADIIGLAAGLSAAYIFFEKRRILKNGPN